MNFDPPMPSRQSLQQQRLKAEGKCRSCWKPNPDPRRTSCPECSDKHLARSRARTGHGHWQPGKRGRCPIAIKDAVFKQADWSKSDREVAIQTGFHIITVTRNRPRYDPNSTDPS